MVGAKNHIATILFVFGVFSSLMAQEYEVAPMSINHWERATFCPVWYEGGLVFTGDRHEWDKKKVYLHKTDKEPTDIYYAATTDQKIQLLAPELSTNFSDGPISFAHEDTVCYFSRNVQLTNFKGKKRKQLVRLGIFTAVKHNGKWTNIQALPINSHDYNVTHPAIHESGNKLYFSSNMPGGFGGYDLYYITKTDTGWSKPVNAGPQINSSGNEVFPSKGGENTLYYSSDGRGGKGGLDIYKLTRKLGYVTIDSIGAPINGPGDDFGILTDAYTKQGYFSSDRDGHDKIFAFKKEMSVFTDCDTLVNPVMCYNFTDANAKPVTGSLSYVWDFGDGSKGVGLNHKHCYKAPGDYTIHLDIIDTSTGNVVMERSSYQMKLQHPEGPVIFGPGMTNVGKEVSFEALSDYAKDLTGEEYFWSFGDGYEAKGDVVSHRFESTGIYDLKLAASGFKAGKRVSECSFMRVRVYDRSFKYELLAKDSVDFYPEPFPDAILSAVLAKNTKIGRKLRKQVSREDERFETEWNAQMIYRLNQSDEIGFNYKKILADAWGVDEALLENVELVWKYIGDKKYASFKYSELAKDGADLANDQLWEPQFMFLSQVNVPRRFRDNTFAHGEGHFSADSTWKVQVAWAFEPEKAKFDYRKLLREAARSAEDNMFDPEIIWSSSNDKKQLGFLYKNIKPDNQLTKFLYAENPTLFIRPEDMNDFAVFKYESLKQDKFDIESAPYLSNPDVTLDATSFELKQLPSGVVYTEPKEDLNPFSDVFPPKGYGTPDSTSRVTHRIIVLESDHQLDSSDPLFASLGDYEVSECYRAIDGKFIYTAGDYAQINLAYLDFSELAAKGYQGATIQSFEVLNVDEPQTNQVLRELLEVASFDSATLQIERMRIFRNIEFESDKHHLRSESRHELKNMARYLKARPEVNVQIRAHTDSTHTHEYNLELSALRAESVAHFLGHHGVMKKRIVSEYLGETMPIASNETEEGKQLNRRVEFRFVLPRAIDKSIEAKSDKP